MAAVMVGTAGWSIPAPVRPLFPEGESLLARYAGLLPAVEVNSSFYRPHRPETWARWAATVPPGFRFAVKMPRAITHQRRLEDAGGLLEAFLRQVAELGDRCGPLLVQLPPSLRFRAEVAGPFLAALRERFDGAVVCEPRHASWFGAAAERLLADNRVARVAADPPPAAGAEMPAGWSGLAYFRLHGAPRIYYSGYDADRLRDLAGRVARLRAAGTLCWVIFDNSASGAATGDALAFLRLVSDR